jgi:hypothetical protein
MKSVSCTMLNVLAIDMTLTTFSSLGTVLGVKKCKTNNEDFDTIYIIWNSSNAFYLDSNT